MQARLAIPALTLALSGGLAACAESAAATRAPVYRGAEPYALGGDLHAFRATIENAPDAAHVEDYATCVAAGYAVENGQGFARKVRVYVKEEGGVWSADAVYSITPTLPGGVMTIDVGSAVADCARRGIPTV